jgi:hypothetical protein
MIHGVIHVCKGVHASQFGPDGPIPYRAEYFTTRVPCRGLQVVDLQKMITIATDAGDVDETDGEVPNRFQQMINCRLVGVQDGAGAFSDCIAA